MEALQGQLTREQYLAFDDASPDKHQFYQGEIFAMSGGSFNHSRIAMNIGVHVQISSNACVPMTSDMRISTPSGLDTYPDVSVYCGDPELTDNNSTLLNPVLIVEVLSKSTQDYDRGDKFNNYRSIPTLQDYLLVDSRKVHVEHFQRQSDTQWLLSEYWQFEDKLALTSVGLEVLVQTVYQGTRFPG